MKKFIILILIVALPFSLFGCNNTAIKDDDTFTIVATLFPAYDFAREITKDNAKVILLLPPGIESHSYEPTHKDIIAIQNSDLFIYNGGLSDAWVDTIIKSFDTPVTTLKMTDAVALQMYNDHDDEDEYDEHVWSSLKNAVKIVGSIVEKIMELDPDNADEYIKNANEYIFELNNLDNDFSDLFKDAKKPLVFADRFPFLYFTKDYSIEYYAAFPGCGHETEPSAKDIALITDVIKERSLSTVFHVEFSNRVIAKSISEDTDTKIKLLHSCHNVSYDEMNKGATYLSLMKQNYETLKEYMSK